MRSSRGDTELARPARVWHTTLLVGIAALWCSSNATTNLSSTSEVPALCGGWPDPTQTAVVNETNYTNADLPDLATLVNGSSVTIPGRGWEVRKAEIQALLQRYMYGTLPQVIPPLVSAAHSEEVTVRGGISFTATLVFATTDTHNVSFTIEVIRPVQPWPGPVVGSKRHPVFLTQANHRRWAILGVSRGCVPASSHPRPTVLQTFAALRSLSRLSLLFMRAPSVDS